MRRLVIVMAIASAVASGAAFEVASIKSHEGPTPGILDFSSSGPRLKLEANTIFGLTAEAYHLKEHQIVYPRPDNTFYDIVAKSEACDTLTSGPDRPIVDQTGFGATFDIRFHFTTGDAITSDPRPTDLSVLDAVDSLGLKLEAQKANVEALVVNHVGEPSAN
jgi:hypothetical protein